MECRGNAGYRTWKNKLNDSIAKPDCDTVYRTTDSFLPLPWEYMVTDKGRGLAVE